MERKFDICYLLAKEGMAFKKYSALYSLEESMEWSLETPTKLRIQQGYILITLLSIKGVVSWLRLIRLTISAF